jgi:hypothetical protein
MLYRYSSRASRIGTHIAVIRPGIGSLSVLIPEAHQSNFRGNLSDMGSIPLYILYNYQPKQFRLLGLDLAFLGPK